MNYNIIPIEDIRGADKTANINPMYSGDRYEFLKNDIKENGQLVPIIICRKLIVDGRHRHKAMLELGVKNIKVEEMPYKSSSSDKEKIMNSSEYNRRHQTPTQLACSAVDIKESTGDSFDCVSEVTGASIANVKRASFIKKNNLAMFEILKSGGKVALGQHGNSSSSLYAVQEFIKAEKNRLEEKAKEIANIEKEAKESSATPEQIKMENALMLQLKQIQSFMGAMFGASDEETRDAIENIIDRI